jgi:hypothetical protein
MTIKHEILATLPQFTGTTKWYRINNYTLLTDGAYYLAETAGAYWLMDLFASYAVREEEFTVLNLTVKKSKATAVIDDGNGRVIAKQGIPFTDFPLDSMKLYGVWSEEYFVIMLPSEH